MDFKYILKLESTALSWTNAPLHKPLYGSPLNFLFLLPTWAMICAFTGIQTGWQSLHLYKVITVLGFIVKEKLN